MTRYRWVLWDWNGTLADDLTASLNATNDILAHHGKPPITLEQYYAYMDTPIRRFYEHLFDLNEVPMEVIGEEFSALYPRYFRGLHPGAAALLAELKAAGVRQVILSASHRENVERDVTACGIRQYFDEIVAAGDLLAESKVERALRWRDLRSISPAEMVVVGDTLHDLDTARALGADCILFAMGHQAEADLRTGGVPVVGDYGQLAALLNAR